VPTHRTSSALYRCAMAGCSENVQVRLAIGEGRADTPNTLMCRIETGQCSGFDADGLGMNGRQRSVKTSYKTIWRIGSLIWPFGFIQGNIFLTQPSRRMERGPVRTGPASMGQSIQQPR